MCEAQRLHDWLKKNPLRWVEEHEDGAPLVCLFCFVFDDWLAELQRLACRVWLAEFGLQS